jgi:hypothetical protein
LLSGRWGLTIADMSSPPGTGRLRKIGLVVTAAVLLAGAAQSAHATSEDLTLQIDVIDSNPYVPPCAGMETPPSWSPEWWDSATSTTTQYDLSLPGDVAATINLMWSDGQDEDCTLISPGGTFTSSISITPNDGWTLATECDVANSCTPITPSIEVDLTPPGGVVDGASYLATVTVAWTP